MNEDLKYIIIGLVAFAIISILSYFIPTTIMMILFLCLLIVVCWNLGIIVQDIIGHATRDRNKN